MLDTGSLMVPSGSDVGSNRHNVAIRAVGAKCKPKDKEWQMLDELLSFIGCLR